MSQQLTERSHGELTAVRAVATSDAAPVITIDHETKGVVMTGSRRLFAPLHWYLDLAGVRDDSFVSVFSFLPFSPVLDRCTLRYQLQQRV